ncbi:MAG: D-alanyl-D-alanine carboxypeptidase family protein [Ruminococcaceae bacterium]|nr:D-alanyl-D-alanine carboxypeptidase family protein [Oscillospiraceae bacterium]
MPYKRYDLKNKYNRRGRKVSERAWLNTVLLVLIPILIITVVLFGIILPLKETVGDNSKTTETTTILQTQEEKPAVSDEELLLIVSENYPLQSDFKPALKPFGNQSVSEFAFADLDKLISDANAEGISIKVQKAYVSFDEQDTLYKETFAKLKKDNDYSEIKAESETKKVCPQAGCSESQTGLLITFSTDEEGEFKDTQAGKWLTKYCVNYGFILRYPENEEDVTGRTADNTIYRYVGIEHAKKMRSYDMTLEAYSAHIYSR